MRTPPSTAPTRHVDDAQLVPEERIGRLLRASDRHGGDDGGFGSNPGARKIRLCKSELRCLNREPVPFKLRHYLWRGLSLFAHNIGGLTASGLAQAWSGSAGVPGSAVP